MNGHSRNNQIEDEELKLRIRPRYGKQVNKRNLFIALQVICVILVVVIMFSLKKSSPKPFEANSNLLRTEDGKKPEGLSQLPSSYDSMPKQANFSLAASGADKSASDVGKDINILELAEQRRIKKLEQKALEAGVMFNIKKEYDARQGGESDRQDSSGYNGMGAYGIETDQNRQHHKLSFINQKPEKKIYNPHGRQTPVSPYQLMAGTLISASMLTGINSDLPGGVIAHVTEHIYDSVTGKHLLIPQGSRMIGKYDNVVAFGQERALVIWQRIILPDGSSVVIDNLPATDASGYTGLEDDVDFHTWQQIKGIALSTLLGISSQLGSSNSESDLIRAIRDSASDGANTAGQEIVKRNLDIQPTITIRPGWPLRIIVNKDIILKPYKIQ